MNQLRVHTAGVYNGNNGLADRSGCPDKAVGKGSCIVV